MHKAGTDLLVLLLKFLRSLEFNLKSSTRKSVQCPEYDGNLLLTIIYDKTIHQGCRGIITHIQTHHFNDNVPDKPGLAGCYLDF